MFWLLAYAVYKSYGPCIFVVSLALSMPSDLWRKKKKGKKAPEIIIAEPPKEAKTFTKRWDARHWKYKERMWEGEASKKKWEGETMEEKRCLSFRGSKG